MSDLTPSRERTGPATSPARLAIEDMKLLASLFHESGMFKKDVASVAQAFVKIKAGEEFGMTPFVAMQSLNIIQGKVEMNGDAQARMLKQSGKYDYRVTQHTDQLCKIEFYRFGIISAKTGENISDTWHPIGESTFTMDDARRAGLLNNQTWQKFPKNMLFYRALTNGVAFHCPDATAFRTYGEGEISGDPPAPAKNEWVDVETGELLDEVTKANVEMIEKTMAIPNPKPTFTEKLKAKHVAQVVNPAPTPVEKLAVAIKARDAGWNAQGLPKHPMDDDEEIETAPASKGVLLAKDLMLTEDQKMFATELAVAQQWIAQIHKESGPDVVRALIEECYGRKVPDLRETTKALKELSLGQLVDGTEALKQKRLEKR